MKGGWIYAPLGAARTGAMAQIGKLSAVEVAKTKGPAVLHDGGGLYLRVASNRRILRAKVLHDGSKKIVPPRKEYGTATTATNMSIYLVSMVFLVALAVADGKRTATHHQVVGDNRLPTLC